MFLTEWNQEEALAHERDEGRAEGITEGIKRMVAGMLKRDLPHEMIADISKLPEDVIDSIACSVIN